MLTSVDLHQRHNLAKTEGQQQWGFFVQDIGLSWRLAQECMSPQEEIRHEGFPYIAKLICKWCAERHSHTSCPLALTDNDSMRQARLDFSRSWNFIYIPRTILELLFSAEICVTMTTLLWLLVKANFRTAMSGWCAYLQSACVALAFSFPKEYISSGDFQKDFQLSTCEGIKEWTCGRGKLFPGVEGPDFP